MNSFRKRARSGQFICATQQTDHMMTSEDRLRRKQRKLQNQDVGSRLYDKYLDACFLEGNEHDWVMSDGQVGPLASIALKLFKASYIPHMQERCARSRNRFFKFQPDKKQEHIRQEFIINGNNPGGKRCRKRIFTRWRLPRLGWKTEMDKLYKFIDESLALKALKVSKEEAKAIIREELLSCKRMNAETYYVGYPPQSRKKTLDGSSPQPVNNVTTFETTEQAYEPQPVMTSNERENFDAEEAVLTESERATVASINRLINTAQHNTKFFLLCKVADDLNGSLLDCIAIALLESCKEDLAACDPLIVDALEYAKMRKLGTADAQSLEARKNRVQATAQMLKIIRRRSPHLPSYEEMQSATLPLLARPTQRSRRRAYDRN